MGLMWILNEIVLVILSTEHEASQTSVNDSDNYDHFISSVDVGRREHDISNWLT